MDLFLTTKKSSGRGSQAYLLVVSWRRPKARLKLAGNHTCVMKREEPSPSLHNTIILSFIMTAIDYSLHIPRCPTHRLMFAPELSGWVKQPP